MEQLLVTKLFIPSHRPDLVLRPRLIERLNGGLHRKLTLISAPAGFGKTTLVTEWLDTLRVDAQKGSRCENRAAWVSLDEGDSDLARFLAYFISALVRVEGNIAEIGKAAIGMLQSSRLPLTAAVLVPLVNEIAAVPDRMVLVLDDYHLIDAQPIHDTLDFLLENQPPNLHLVLATREDPPLQLSRLRARDQLTELRAADLRFTSAEAAEFLNRVMGLDISTEDIAALEIRTEGWIAGLQLAAISLQGHTDATRLIQTFTGSHRLVLDYLVEDVLDHQPQNIQDFLLQTAVLDRLTSSLCNVLTGQEDGQAILELLERANLFVVPLDNERHWYRYHHLFADVLQARLRTKQPDQVAILHRRASEWYEQKGLTPEAVRHALAGRDFKRAAGLVELAWPAWSESPRSITWLGWVNALPEELVRARPVLCVAYAQSLLNAGKLEAAEARLLDVERWLGLTTGTPNQPEPSAIEMVVVDEEQFRSLAATLAMTRAYHAQAVGDIRGTVKYAGQALDLLPESEHYNRAAVTGLLGLANWASGDLEAAHSTFSDGLFGNLHDMIKGTFVVADIKATLGRLNEALDSCERALKLAYGLGEPLLIGTEDVYTGISALHREQGDLEAAAQDLATSKKLGDQVELPDWQYRWCIAQARLKQTLGDLDSALELLDEAERLYVRTPLPEVRPIAAMKTRVWARQGRLSEALGWARERGLSVHDELSYLSEFEHITLARVLIASYRDHGGDSIHDAVGLLERLLKTAEEGARKGSMIEILVLQALAFEAQGNISHALAPLERSLALGEPEGYQRMFVDEGPPMARLLYEALARGIAPRYVQRLLAAFPVVEPEPADRSVRRPSESGLIEPLSEREIEILQLIADGLTNQEIAVRLYLSLNTVKVHARNIYGKLGVTNRTQASSRARALGILIPG